MGGNENKTKKPAPKWPFQPLAVDRRPSTRNGLLLLLPPPPLLLLLLLLVSFWCRFGRCFRATSCRPPPLPPFQSAFQNRNSRWLAWSFWTTAASTGTRRRRRRRRRLPFPGRRCDYETRRTGSLRHRKRRWIWLDRPIDNEITNKQKTKAERFRKRFRSVPPEPESAGRVTSHGGGGGHCRGTFDFVFFGFFHPNENEKRNKFRSAGGDRKTKEGARTDAARCRFKLSSSATSSSSYATSSSSSSSAGASSQIPASLFLLRFPSYVYLVCLVFGFFFRVCVCVGRGTCRCERSAFVFPVGDRAPI